MQISEGEGYTFDTITWVETADLAYEVSIEHNRATLRGATEKVPISLRVTTVFRREDDAGRSYTARGSDNRRPPHPVGGAAERGTLAGNESSR